MIVSIEPFATRIRERYPEGLTGIFAIGATRTTYILERNRNRKDPGRIDDFEDYAAFTLQRYLAVMGDFFELGGQNLIIPPLAYQTFSERGEAYAEMISRLTLQLISDQMQSYYKEEQVDPYFVGIDTLLTLPHDQAAYRLGYELDKFQKHWPCQQGRRKIIWEIAPIPLFSFWRAHEVMDNAAQVALEKTLAATTDMEAMYQALFKYYAKASIGTEIPVPHFYIGTNRNGDMKLRSMVPISLICGGPFRLFYLPYPSLFMTRETLRTILEDLAFGRQQKSKRYDYRAQYTSEEIEAEYERILKLSSDPASVIGLSRPEEND